MKHLTQVVLAIVLTTNVVSAQSMTMVGGVGSRISTPQTTEDRPGYYVPQGAAPSNAFAVGAQVNTLLGSDDGFAGSLIGSGLIKYTPLTFKVSGKDIGFVHVFTNLSDIGISDLASPSKIKEKLKELVTGSSGLEGRAYGEIATRSFSAWMSGGMKLNGGSDSADIATITQIRASLGGEWRVGAGSSSHPVSLSSEVFVSKLMTDGAEAALDLRSSTLPTIEFTGIVPLTVVELLRSGPFKNIGIVAEAVVGLRSEIPNQWRLGFLISKAGA